MLGVVGSLTALACVPFVGYIYELLGRRCVILSCLFLSCALLVVVPYTSPNYTLLVIVRSILGALESFASTNPLIPDYVKSESRGKGNAIRASAYLIGEIFSMVALFGMTVNMELNKSFTFAAIICTLLTLIIPFVVREPKIKSPAHEPETDNSQAEE